MTVSDAKNVAASLEVAAGVFNGTSSLPSDGVAPIGAAGACADAVAGGGRMLSKLRENAHTSSCLPGFALVTVAARACL